MEDLGGDVTAGIVRAEREARVLERPDQRAPGKAQRVLRIEPARARRHHQDDQEQAEPDQRGGAAEEQAKGAHGRISAGSITDTAPARTSPCVPGKRAALVRGLAR